MKEPTKLISCEMCQAVSAVLIASGVITREDVQIAMEVVVEKRAVAEDQK